MKAALVGLRALYDGLSLTLLPMRMQVEAVHKPLRCAFEPASLMAAGFTGWAAFASAAAFLAWRMPLAMLSRASCMALVSSRQTEAGLRLVHCESPEGNYRRVFLLSEEVDREGIEATVKDGVLKLVLPKSPKAMAQKITVKSE